MNRLKETFFLMMIVLSFHLANAQEIKEFGRMRRNIASDVRAASLYSPPSDSIKKFGWITDSITWVATDTTFEGDCKCEHEWVIGNLYPLAIRSFNMIYMKSNFVLVCASGYHPENSMRFVDSKYPSHDPEEHCPFEVMEREKICRKCLFSVIEREKWSQHFIAPPKGEFELLKEKQRAKR